MYQARTATAASDTTYRPTRNNRRRENNFICRLHPQISTDSQAVKPFSIALQKIGGVELVANLLTAVIRGAGTYGVLASLFAVTALLGVFISNTATAVLMAPVHRRRRLHRVHDAHLVTVILVSWLLPLYPR